MKSHTRKGFSVDPPAPENGTTKEANKPKIDIIQFSSRIFKNKILAKRSSYFTLQTQ